MKGIRLLKHKKRIGILLSLVMVVLLAHNMSNASAFDTVQAATESKEYRNIGYYASWAGYARAYGIDKVDYSKITHLNFAFANLTPEGRVIVGDPWIDCQITSLYPDAGFTWEDQSNNRAGHFGMLRKIKEQYPHLKTLISIGGWTWSRNFSDVAADPSKRETMAQTAVDFILTYGFDGIDIDWEYPVEGGDNIPHRPSDKENYVELVKLIRQKLNAQSARDGKTYLLTIAAAANQNYVNNINVPEMMKYLDWINLMTYDYHGGFDPQTNHNAPLYLNPNDNTGSIFSIDATVNAYLNAGARPEDLNLGLPFYGRGWINVNATPSTCLFHNGSPSTSMGLDRGTWEGSTWDYWDIKQNYINQRGYVRYWDDYAKCPYLFSEQTKVFITYDDTESLGYKLNYLKSKNLGGAMFWEFSGDKYGELLTFTANALGINQNGSPTDPTVTPTPTPTPIPGDEDDVPAWNSTTVYMKGDRVSYNGSIYEAQWWTQGDVPGEQEWGPWKFIRTINGSNPTPTTTPTPPVEDDIAPWDSSAVYVKGDLVSYNGKIYEAQWWTQGEAPGAQEWGPWKYIRPID